MKPQAPVHMPMPRNRLLSMLAAATLALSTVGACGGSDDPTEPTVSATVEATTFAPSLGIDLNAAGWVKSSSGLWYRVLSVPTAATPVVTSGQHVTVKYTGWLSNGNEFQSSTFGFTVGRGEVIGGWDQGIAGMRVGERRRLLIPPSIGYGSAGNQGIPGNAVLVFDVEVISSP